MGAMNYARRHPRAAVLGIGVASALAAPMWVGHGMAGPPAGILFVLALEAIPVLLLAAASDAMPWWLAVVAAAAFGTLTDWGLHDAASSTSSMSALAIFVVPLLLVFAVPCLVAAYDLFVLTRLALGGARFDPPRRGEIVLTIVLGLLGFLASFVFGLIAGLAVGFAVWAHRVRPNPVPRT
jgi:hypothetical protein